MPPAPRSGLTGTPELKALGEVRWRWIGPANQAGRIPMIVGIPGDRSTYYVGAAAGGLFKTTNGGVTFEALFDEQDNASIGDLAIAPTNPSILLPRHREEPPTRQRGRRRLQVGRRRQELEEVGLGTPRRSPSASIPPTRTSCLAHWAAPGDRTRSAGSSRRPMGQNGARSYVDELTGCSASTSIRAANVVWAGMHRHRAGPGISPGGGATGVYKSVDGGESWTRLSACEWPWPAEGDMDRWELQFTAPA
jgi:hypothetical protein